MMATSGNRSWLGLAEVERLDGSAKKHETPCGDGVMVWREWGAGPALILLHGGFGSWKHWVSNIPALADKFTVYAADLPGLGESQMPPEPISAESVGDIIGDGIDALIGSDSRFSIGAFSLGAVIATLIVKLRYACVDQAVFIGAGGLGPYWRNAVGDLRRRSSSMTEEMLRDLVRENLSQTMIGNPALIDEDVITLQLGLLNRRERLIGLPMSQSDIVLRCLPAIAGKSVFVWGRMDPYLDPDVGQGIESLRADFPELDARIIEDAGHWANFEQPARIEEIFLERS